MSGVSRGAKSQSASQPSRLEVFASFIPGLPADEAIMRTTAAGVVMAPNKRLSKALVCSDEWKAIQEALPCWTGTMTAYVEPGKTFHESSERIASMDNAHYVVYTDPETNQRWLFRIPEEHLDKKDAILVVEHPEFLLAREGNDWIVHALIVDLVEKFPTSNGWYIGDAKYDIPQGNIVDQFSNDARCLWRIEKQVGLLVCDRYYDYRRDVDACSGASYGLGVASIIPEKSVPKRFDLNPTTNYRQAAKILEPEDPVKSIEPRKGYFARTADKISGLF